MSAPQRSEQWHRERQGKLTASAFGQAAGLGPGSRQQLWRRLMGVEVFEGNEATQWGVTQEPVALAAYQKEFNVTTTEVGFVQHPSMEWLGASPDFLVGIGGVGEIKCPYNQTLYDEIPPYYMAQVQGQIQVANATFAHFVCWTPVAMRVWKVNRSDSYWDWLHLRLADFWCWVVAQIEPPREKKIASENIPSVECSVLKDIVFNPASN